MLSQLLLVLIRLWTQCTVIQHLPMSKVRRHHPPLAICLLSIHPDAGPCLSPSLSTSLRNRNSAKRIKHAARDKIRAEVAVFSEMPETDESIAIIVYSSSTTVAFPGIIIQQLLIARHTSGP